MTEINIRRRVKYETQCADEQKNNNHSKEVWGPLLYKILSK